MDETRESQPSLTHYIGVVWKHKWLVLLFGTLVVAGTYMFTQRQPRIYEAVTQLVIDAQAPQYLSNGGGNEVVSLGTANTWNSKEYFETQYRILRSRMVAAMVVERLGLNHDLDFLGINAIEDPEQRARALERADAVSLLAARVNVEPIEDSNIVLVKVRDEVPERAAKLADAISVAYGDANLDRKISAAKDAVAWLNGQVKQVEQDVAKAEDALIGYKKERGILSASLGDKQNLTGLRSQDADRQLREARAESARLGGTLDQVKRLNVEEAQTSVEEVLQNGLIQRLKEQLVSLQNERSDLLKRYLESHPDVKAADEKIARVRAALTQEVGGIRQSMERKYQAAVASERKLSAEVGGIQREMESLNADELQYKRLEAAVETQKSLLAQLLLRVKEAQLQAEARANNVRILDAALVPERPVSPRMVLNLSVAVVVALFGGIGLALLVDGLDASVKSQDQLEKELGLTFLGIIPSIRSARARNKNRHEGTGPVDPDRYVLQHPNSTVAECVRTIRTNLLFMAPERELRKLLITSAGPREGKTSSSVNIAATMAGSGGKVLLVDSDLRRPRIHKVFDVTNDRGLTNMVMNADLEPSDVVRPSGVENLDILCSGPIPPNPAELLHTQAFKRSVDKLLAHYDRIIFDSPPVVAVADALILGTQCDGAILVVRAGDTSREMVRKARRLLMDVKINILGALLNNVDVHRRGYGNQYYAYYRAQGSYYSEEPAADPAPPR